MPLSRGERLGIIAELRALDPVRWASLIRYHQARLREEGKRR